VIGEAGGSGNVVRMTPNGVITTLTANSPVNVVRPVRTAAPHDVDGGDNVVGGAADPRRYDVCPA
jgi:hypothetical protein